MILAWLVGCGSEGDPIALAWNVIVEVEAMAEDPGCEPAVTESEPDRRFVGIGYGRDALNDAAALYWCRSTDECDALPWAAFLVQEATETSLVGESGQVSLTGGELCLVSWAGAEATIDGDRISIDARLFSGSPTTVEEPAECDRILEAVVGASCDLTRSLEGTIAP